jgi:tetratricopeptide (TPR) repeat protein
LAISRQIGDRRGEGNTLGNLGNAYLRLREYPKAIGYYEGALAISRQIGDRRGEGNTLGKLGNAYRDLGQYLKAVEYYPQAKAIFEAIGVPPLIEQINRLIAETQRKMSGTPSQPPPRPASAPPDRSALKSQAAELRRLYAEGGEAVVREHLQAQGKSAVVIKVILDGFRREGGG